MRYAFALSFSMPTLTRSVASSAFLALAVASRRGTLLGLTGLVPAMTTAVHLATIAGAADLCLRAAPATSKEPG